jgi:hypothetical protein
VEKSNGPFPNRWNDSVGNGHETFDANSVLAGGGNAAGGVVSARRRSKKLQQQWWPQLLILVA